MKTCNKCGISKPLTDFYSNHRSKISAPCSHCYNRAGQNADKVQAPIVTLNPNRERAYAEDARHVRRVRLGQLMMRLKGKV